jgi:hypothetical protein
MGRASRAKRQVRITVTEGGIQQEAMSRWSSPLPDPVPGQHMWVTLAMHRIADPRATRFYADLENLLTIEGPMCYWCEQPATDEVLASPCPGMAP